jgi:23S rRNA pseudouridine2605 synthase
VRALQRVGFGPLRLGELPAGAHRRLTPAEVERLRKAPRDPPRKAPRDPG